MTLEVGEGLTAHTVEHAWRPGQSIDKLPPLKSAGVKKALDTMDQQLSMLTATQRTSFTAVLIYVDDILLTGNDLQEIKRLKEFFLKRFYSKISVT